MRHNRSTPTLAQLPRKAAAAALAALLLIASAPLEAQTAAPPALSRDVAAREGNIYDHRDHQPTAADVGAAPPSRAGAEAADQEVQSLLRQTDVLDRQSEEQHRTGR